MDLSVVIPLYNEQDSLAELTARLVKELQALNRDYEIIFVDDGSSDDSFARLIELEKQYPGLRIVRFRRNFGKSAALSEGFKRARGEIVFTLDADLQDDPVEIPNFLKKINEGFDLVSGWKKKRNDPLSKTVPSKLFNYTTRVLTGIRIHDFNCGFKAYRNEVIKALPVYGELHRYMPVLAHWQGFKVDEVVVRHHARKHGKTKFGIRRFFDGFFDLLTVLFITRYRQKPLHLFGFLGAISMIFGFGISAYLTVLKILGQGIGNRPLLFLGVLLIIVGVQLFSLGLIGEMLASTRAETISYAIRDEIN